MVYQCFTRLLLNKLLKGEKVTISLEAFKPGNYFVHIQNKTEVIRKQIIA